MNEFSIDPEALARWAQWAKDIMDGTEYPEGWTEKANEFLDKRRAADDSSERKHDGGVGPSDNATVQR